MMNHLQRMKDKNRKNYNKSSPPRPGRCRTLLRLTTFCLKYTEQLKNKKVLIKLKFHSLFLLGLLYNAFFSLISWLLSTTELLRYKTL